MKFFLKKHLISIAVYSTCAIFVFFSVLINNQAKNKTHNSLDKIEQIGKIRLISNLSATTYHLYNSTPMGFEYDLASKYAQFLNVELDIVTPGWNNIIPYLETGKGDFIAAGLTITKQRLTRVNFSIPYLTIQQRLIYHNDKEEIERLEDLAGKTIHVRRGTSYHNRLKILREEGIDLNYILHNNTATKDFIGMVARKEIDYTIADSNIAYLNRRYHPDIRVGISLQQKESHGWAIRKKDSELQKSINKFLVQARKDGTLNKLYNKYYNNIAAFDYYDIKIFHKRIVSRLPKYKEIIINQAEKYHLDWKIIAAIAYQESHFEPLARSYTNVRGLMQVTMDTAREMGITNRLDPYQSIMAGSKYLSMLYNRFIDIDDHYQRILFSIASYNIGYYHIRDAQNIAELKGLDKNDWHSIKGILPLLAKRKYYKATKYGYARGYETVNYVTKILTYYDILKQKEKNNSNIN
ncbi:MAG: membrane-bound lytic murein transglycosylase MltF [Desulfobacteraceae bacterium]|nr:membrane-bound lytic murein transglycosylase MltF [Desulfobacteraceae bacterium]